VIETIPKGGDRMKPGVGFDVFHRVHCFLGNNVITIFWE